MPQPCVAPALPLLPGPPQPAALADPRPRGPKIGTQRTTPARWQPSVAIGAEGFVTDLDGPVHWVRWGEASTAPDVPPAVFVHGLGGSHLDWSEVAPALVDHRVGYALDLRGFGLSPVGGGSGGEQQARLLVRFVDAVVGRSVRLVGHGMGALVCLLAAQAYASRVHSLVLLAPTLPHRRTQAGPGIARERAWHTPTGILEGLARRSHSTHSSKVTVRGYLDRVFADPRRAPSGVVERTGELLRLRTSRPEDFGDIDRAYTLAARSVHRVLRGRRRFATTLQEIDVPVLIVHAREDRVVPAAASRTVAMRHLHWTYVELPQGGHVPHLEDPDLLIDIIGDWWAASSAV